MVRLGFLCNAKEVMSQTDALILSNDYVENHTLGPFYRKTCFTVIATFFLPHLFK
jgi:hypothetical protein